MSKTLISLIGATLLIGLGIFAFQQNTTIGVQDKTIITQKKEIVSLEESLDITIEEKHALLAENAVLKDQISILRDSVKMLNKKVAVLRRQVKKQKNTIRAIQAKVKKFETEYAALKNKIAILSREGQANKDLIAKMETEKTNMRTQVNSLNAEIVNKVKKYQMTKEELMDLKASRTEMERIAKITDNTKVLFQHISIRKDRYGKPLKKVGKDGKKWRYTLIKFNLENSDQKMILDEKFMVKIIDKDTGEPISHIEPNPSFPDSYVDSKGITFKYDGNLVELAFRNNEAKKASSYEVQVSYINGNDEYLLLNGTKTFILGKKIIK